MSASHRALLSELSTGTWFKVIGSELVTQTHGGSRPGDGLADLIFGFVFGRLLANLKTSLATKGLWSDEPWILPVEREQILDHLDEQVTVPCNLDVIWADDLALAFRNDYASELVDDIKLVAADLFDWCALFGMTPNTGRGKSEILLQLRGPHSREVRLQVFSGDSPALEISPQRCPPMKLHLVHLYKHLGAQLHIGTKLLHEIRIRSGMMRTAYNLYRKKVFGNSGLGLKQHGQLLESMIFSILRWNIGGWYELDGNSYKRYRASILNLIRRTCMVPHGAETVWSWPDDKVLSMLLIPDPQDTLHLARLSFFTTAFHTGPDELWVLMKAEKTWLRCVSRALHWLYDQLRGSTNFAGLHEFEAEWIRGVRLKGAKWRGWIKRAKTHSVLQRYNRCHVVSWHAAFYDKLIDNGLDIQHVTPELQEDVGPHPHACGPCKQVFKTHTAWATHANRRHGRQDPLRAYLTDGKCKCCGNQYHTTRRLLAHLHYNKLCASSHVALTEEIEIGPGRNSRGEDQDRNLPLPVIKPQRPLRIIADELEDLEKYRKAVSDLRFERIFIQSMNEMEADRNTSPQEVQNRVRMLILENVVAIGDAWNAMVNFYNGLSTDSVLARGLRATIDNWSLHWLFDGYEVSWPTSSYVSHSMSKLKADMLMLPSSVPSADGPVFSVQRPVGREIFLIHFFSGVRRQGDIQWWAETSQIPAGVILTAISVDIIFHERRGDLADEDMQRQWLSFILRACVAAAFIGPPCSTWSIARWRYYLQKDDGPRPIRTSDLPFGLPSLRLKEVRDLILGNVLLLFAFDVLLLQLLLGRVCVIEHPAPGTERVQKAASIWHLQVMRQLKRFPGIQEIMVFQGHFGAVSPKPTHFAVSNAPDAQDLVDGCRTTSVLPQALEMGRSEGSDAFNTAQLREYPKALSKGLAAIALHWIRQNSTCEDVQNADLAPEHQELIQPFRVDLIGLFGRGADTRGQCGNL